MEGDATARTLASLTALSFLSTPSGWRATANYYEYSPEELISIHALRVEGDAGALYATVPATEISIHALRVEGDLERKAGVARGAISIHALRVEGDSI